MRLATLRAKYAALAPVFTERSRRLWAATEAQGSASDSLAGVPPLSHPLQFVLIALAGWINQQQREVIDYLQEENRVLRA